MIYDKTGIFEVILVNGKPPLLMNGTVYRSP